MAFGMKNRKAGSRKQRRYQNGKLPDLWITKEERETEVEAKTSKLPGFLLYFQKRREREEDYIWSLENEIKNVTQELNYSEDRRLEAETELMAMYQVNKDRYMAERECRALREEVADLRSRLHESSEQQAKKIQDEDALQKQLAAYAAENASLTAALADETERANKLEAELTLANEARARAESECAKLRETNSAFQSRLDQVPQQEPATDTMMETFDQCLKKIEALLSEQKTDRVVAKPKSAVIPKNRDAFYVVVTKENNAMLGQVQESERREMNLRNGQPEVAMTDIVEIKQDPSKLQSSEYGQRDGGHSIKSIFKFWRNYGQN